MTINCKSKCNAWCHVAAARQRGFFFFFLLCWVKSAVCQNHYLLCRVWHHLPEVKGSGISSLKWNIHSQTHKPSHTRNNHETLTDSHRGFSNTHEHTGVHIQALRGKTQTQPWVCDRWRRLIASALHHEWQQEVVRALSYRGRGN